MKATSPMQSIRVTSDALLAGICVLYVGCNALITPAFAQENILSDNRVETVISPGIEFRRWQPDASNFNQKLFQEALKDYQDGNITHADGLSLQQRDPAVRAALEWAAIRSARATLGSERLLAFLNTNADFPMSGWIRRRVESALFDEKQSGEVVRNFFANYKPDTAAGKLLLANQLNSDGDRVGAEALVRDAWRENTVSSGIERMILANYPDVIGDADRRYRAERLVYKHEFSEALRVGAKLGADYVASLRALNAAIRESGDAKILLDAVAPSERGKAPAIFARAQIARRSGRLIDAATALRQAPTSADKLVNPNEWWQERRLLARKLLDANEITPAYAVASGFKAGVDGNRVEAEWMAGWIALRYLNDAEAAEAHFFRATRFAKTPLSVSRSNYWLGRARQAQGRDASAAYGRASIYGATYYGQLAGGALNLSDLNLRNVTATDSDRAVFENRTGAKVIRLLLDNQAKELALPLAADMAQILGSSIELDAFGKLLVEQGNPNILLIAAKIANQRGFPMDIHAFPTFGIPEYAALPGSAEKAMVYAIARQESAFEAKAVSGAGARGLMQMMPATATATARQFSVPFSLDQLIVSPQTNARLGAAHLGHLIQSYRGSYMMVFGAYNAGPGRVQEWVKAYGDPREATVDPIDWIERIPISETRNYVQRVMENMQVYRSILKKDKTLQIHADMRRGQRPIFAIRNDDEIITGKIPAKPVAQ